MKLIYTLILLLFSSSVFAEFVYVDISISNLLDYGFVIKQIDTLNTRESVYHLYKTSRKSESIAIYFIWDTDTYCMIDTQDKDLITILNISVGGSFTTNPNQTFSGTAAERWR